MIDAFQILGFGVLSLVCFYLGLSEKAQTYGGRSGKTFPLSRFQQRFEGLLWGFGLLALGSLKTLSVLRPGTMGAERHESLITVIFVGCVVATFIVALLDPRIRAIKKESKTGYIVVTGTWFLAVLALLLVIREIWVGLIK